MPDTLKIQFNVLTFLETEEFGENLVDFLSGFRCIVRKNLVDDRDAAWLQYYPQFIALRGFPARSSNHAPTLRCYE